jgi:glucosamine--fructose-6-phosphate aminotransferase (isomerizing)
MNAMHLEREIAEQPQVTQRLLEAQWAETQRIAAAIRAFAPAFVCIAARGTSDNAARYAQYLFGTHVRLMVGLATPSVNTLYGSAPNLARALVIGISQSGQSADIRQVLADAHSQGALTLAITNDPSSPLAAGADHHLYLEAGTELSVAATKTYTAQLTAVAMLVAALAEDAAFEKALRRVPALLSETLERSHGIAGWIERYRYIERFAAIGRGYNYCTAFEIALKIKELNGLTGEGYSEADFRHGPIAILSPGFPVIVIAPQGRTLPTQLDLLEKLHEKRAECVVISNDAQARIHARQYVALPAVIEPLSPILAVVPGQVMAMRLALTRDLPVDQPVGLTKVTNTY